MGTRYIVQWNYRTHARGPWVAGDEVELSEAEAAAVNCDSPGVLVGIGDAAPAAPVVRDISAPPADRQLRGPGRRRQVGG